MDKSKKDTKTPEKSDDVKPFPEVYEHEDGSITVMPFWEVEDGDERDNDDDV